MKFVPGPYWLDRDGNEIALIDIIENDSES